MGRVMTKKSEKRKNESGLWIPNHIRNIPRSVLGDSEKMLLAEIYSFGDKGFYKANDTIAKEYMTSERTISRWIANILNGRLVYVKNPKGYYRTFWAKSHPDVKTAVKLWHRDKEIPKTDCKPVRVRQNCPTGLDKNGEVTATNGVFRLGQKCPATNKETTKETKKDNIATPTPLPAGGQAPALLEDRKAEQQVSVERFKRNFGIGKKKHTPLPPKDFKQEQQKQLKALQANKKNEKF